MAPKEPKTYTQAEVDAAVTAAVQTARAEAVNGERSRVKEIHACCVANRMEPLFLGMMEEGVSITNAGRRIQDILAVRDEQTEVTSRHGHRSEEKDRVDTAAIYDQWGKP